MVVIAEALPLPRYANEATLNRDGTLELDDAPDFCTMSCGVPASFIS